MAEFLSIELSSSGRPVLKEGEVEIKLCENVVCQNALKENMFPTCTLHLTNMQLIAIVNSTPPIAKALHLSKIHHVEDCASFFHFSKRIRVYIDEKKTFELKFFGGDKEMALEKIIVTLQRKAWLEVAALKKVEEPILSISQAGIGGLMRRQEKEHKTVDRIANAAISDMSTLISSAREVVSVIERYVAYSSGQGVAETASEISEENELSNILLSIGIISPVTKISAGKKYHEQLARQLADILKTDNRLQRLGGMITLTDLYCIYNRARGTDLVSPDDLLEGVKCMQTLSLGIKLRKFDSGVMVAQDISLDDSEISNNILSLASQSMSMERGGEGGGMSGISPSMVSKHFKISLLIAKEHLLIAEEKEIICRDETINGLFFFPNIFSFTTYQYSKK